MKKFYYLKRLEENKYGFVYTEDFKTDGIINEIDVLRCINFAYAMVWGEGWQRANRSGGITERSDREIFLNTFQGKMTECALYKYLQEHNLRPDAIDFNIYEKGKWDTVDITCNRHRIAVKSTKHYGQLLLLETKDWDENGNYIPNEKTNMGEYDEVVLMRIKPSVDDVIKQKSDFWDINLEEQLAFLKNIRWEYDFPGYITHEDLKYIIQKHYIIKQGDLLGKIKENYKGIPMDANNYYVQATNMRRKEEFLQRIRKIRETK